MTSARPRPRGGGTSRRGLQTRHRRNDLAAEGFQGCDLLDVGHVEDGVLHAERATFYNPARAGHYYAAAWSFVHFLKHGKAVQGNPKWAALLAGYFDTVKAEYARATEGVAAGDQQQRAMASMKARREALKKVLDGIDLQALEAAWVQYVVAMKDPWPQLRKQRK